jgi:cyclophilin family peptidyl-prolyl cis-trans isomerase
MSPLRLLPLLGLLALVAGCGGGGEKSAAGCEVVGDPPPAAARTAPKPTAKLDPSKTYEVTMQTNCGDFTIRLDPEQSPNASASVVSLVRRGFFDNTIFHRISTGFVVQGGDPTATGTGGPGYTTVDTPPSDAAYPHGVVAMAKTQVEPPGTAGSQFFIVLGPGAQLPPDYAIVGNVTDGLDVVDRIGTLGDANEQPTEVVEIEKATVTES